MSSFYDRFNWITVAQGLSASEKTLSFALLKHLNQEGTCGLPKSCLPKKQAFQHTISAGWSNPWSRRGSSSALQEPPKDAPATSTDSGSLPTRRHKSRALGQNRPLSLFPKEISAVDGMSPGGMTGCHRGGDMVTLVEWTGCLPWEDRMSWGG